MTAGDEGGRGGVSRRTFLWSGVMAGGGLVVAATVPGLWRGGGDETPVAFRPNAFVRLESDGSVVVAISKSEMGQGVTTSLALLVAEELDADWRSIRVERVPLDEEIYGPQATGGSSTVRLMWEPLRNAGAAARVILVAAAADRWGVAPAECTTEGGTVLHGPTGRTARYRDLLEAAATLPVPQDPPLKAPRDYRLLGRRYVPIAGAEIARGGGGFGLDVRVPGMRFAAVARPPMEEALLESYDDTAARAVPGVEAVVEVPTLGAPYHVRGGVAVIARNTWTAMRGRDALDVVWTRPAGPPEDSERLRQAMLRRSEGAGGLVAERGAPSRALREVGNRVVATYELPFLAQAPLEPMNCTAFVEGDRCTLWTPAQFPGWAAQGVAEALGLPAGNVAVHVTRMGGGFGRRINPDFSVEAALVARHAEAPVQVVWSREEDLRFGFYRPAVVHRLEARLDDQGRPEAILHRLVSASHGVPPESEVVQTGGGGTDMSGTSPMPYRCPNHRFESVGLGTRMKRGWWRSVTHTHAAFAAEAFMTELAAAAGRDPLEYRLALIDGSAPMPLRPEEGEGEEYEFDPERLRTVLRLVAERGDWGSPLPQSRGRGIACRWAMSTYVAEIVEVEVSATGQMTIPRVTAAVDCGIVVNRDGAEAQIEGGIIDALSAARGQEITVREGRVVEGNFDVYPLSRMAEAPSRVDVHFVESDRRPSGLGEPGVPPAAPALFGALHQATGRWYRRLPFRHGPQ